MNGFPNASKDFYALNPHLANPGAATEPKRPARNAALAPAQAEIGDSGRFLVRLTSVRKRLLDEDNLVGKYHTDLLRYSGILPCDSPDRVSIETHQRKTAKGEEEHTLVEIFAI